MAEVPPDVLMPNLNVFINEFKHGFQKENRYRVQIYPNPVMVDAMNEEARLRGVPEDTLSAPQTVEWLSKGILAEASRMPDRGFACQPLTMYGLTEHMPYHAEFSDFECTFLMPHVHHAIRDNVVPRFFTLWQNQIQNMSEGPSSGLDFRFPSHYYAVVLVSLLDNKGRRTLTYRFDNAYPFLVHSGNLAWGSDNQFTKLQVSFKFSYWTLLPPEHLNLNETISEVIDDVEDFISNIPVIGQIL
jgi:hypothetical protein